ncbi:MAG: hypothetical protein SF029_08035 [bacterium]|nr:hypothetical protein [bacterium]
MSEAKLQQARTFIQTRRYREARAILQQLPNDPTAQKWLTKLDSMMSASDGAPASNGQASDNPALQQARQLIQEKRFDEARALLLRHKDNLTAQKWLARLDEIAPAAANNQGTKVGTNRTFLLAGGGLVVLFVVLMVVALLVRNSSGGNNADSPAGAVRGFARALFVEQDLEQAASYYCEALREQVALGLGLVMGAMASGEVQDIDISDLTYEVTEQTAGIAEVRVGGTVSAVVNGEREESSFSEVFGGDEADNSTYLIRENGRWVMCENGEAGAS